MRRYIISLIIFTLCFSGFALAQDNQNQLKTNWLERIYHKIDQKILTPVKESIESLPQDAAKGIKYLSEKAEEKRQAKQEEIKQEVKKKFKEKVKEWTQSRLDWLKNKVLNPLKNKIQEGSTLIKKGINKIKDYLIEIF